MARKSQADRLREAREKLGKGELDDAEVLAEERRRQADASARRTQEQIIQALEKEIEELEARQDFLDRLFKAPDPDPYKITSRKSRGRKADAQATYVMLASDWHMGERVRPENVGWRNEYDPDIAQERAEQFFRSQVLMLNSARSAWSISQGILWLGGDLMTGYIHEEYLIENFLSPVEEALLVHDTLVRGIRFLLDRSDLEHVLVPTNHGNHGRIGTKKMISASAKTSYEWMLYHFLARTFADEPRVTFQISTGYYNVVDVYGFRLGFHHGDAVKFQGGIGGPTVPINKRIGRQAQSIPPRWEGTTKGAPHFYAQGHLHTLMMPKGFCINGSLIGWNDFADTIGASYEDPAQASFVVDERYKVVSNFNPIIVTKPRK